MPNWLGVELPIIQAPMAGVQGSALAVAVARAGGLGSLPCALLSTEAMRRELAALAQQTNAAYNVNFFCHTQPTADSEREQAWRAMLAPYYRELGVATETDTSGPLRIPFDAEAAAVLDQVKPPIVSFHFGLPPAGLLRRVKACGSKILASATTVDEARWLEAHGADAIIAQGLEAGGHRGNFLSDDLTRQVGTMALVPQIVHAVSCPVIAAGGIGDPSGVRAALALGAVAVQIGTAFLLCPEASTSSVHRAALSAEAARHTAVTNLFTGRPARGVMNRLMRELGPLRSDVPAFPLASGPLTPLRAKAEAQGLGDFSPLWAGQHASACRAIPAGDLTRHLAH